jgi:hypothetical protein
VTSQIHSKSANKLTVTPILLVCSGLECNRKYPGSYFVVAMMKSRFLKKQLLCNSSFTAKFSGELLVIHHYSKEPSSTQTAMLRPCIQETPSGISALTSDMLTEVLCDIYKFLQATEGKLFYISQWPLISISSSIYYLPSLNQSTSQIMSYCQRC